MTPTHRLSSSTATRTAAKPSCWIGAVAPHVGGTGGEARGLPVRSNPIDCAPYPTACRHPTLRIRFRNAWGIGRDTLAVGARWTSVALSYHPRTQTRRRGVLDHDNVHDPSTCRRRNGDHCPPPLGVDDMDGGVCGRLSTLTTSQIQPPAPPPQHTLRQLFREDLVAPSFRAALSRVGCCGHTPCSHPRPTRRL